MNVAAEYNVVDDEVDPPPFRAAVDGDEKLTTFSPIIVVLFFGVVLVVIVLWRWQRKMIIKTSLSLSERQTAWPLTRKKEAEEEEAEEEDDIQIFASKQAKRASEDVSEWERICKK